MTLAERLATLFAELGLERAHIAASIASDWNDLALTRPDLIASLSLICPPAVAVDKLSGLECRVRVLCLESAKGFEFLRDADGGHSTLAVEMLEGYNGLLWSDVAADRPERVIRTITAAASDGRAVGGLQKAAAGSEINGIRYRVQGKGPPLLLFPLALAPSQWDPVTPELAEHFTVITLSGSELGAAAMLESRGRCVGYREMVLRVLAKADIRTARRILEVGCGTGVVTRCIASSCAAGARVTAVDINRYLLQEARILVDRAGLGGTIEVCEGHAERLEFPADSFGASVSVTAMEEVDADVMLAELLRVTRPGGRIAVVVRAVDTPRIVNAPLPPTLKQRVETDRQFTSGAAASGCADDSLYSRFANAGLQNVQMFPQLVSYTEPERVTHLSQRIDGQLSANDKAEWRKAIAAADRAGTLFFSDPLHCAVGTVPDSA